MTPKALVVCHQCQGGIFHAGMRLECEHCGSTGQTLKNPPPGVEENAPGARKLADQMVSALNEFLDKDGDALSALIQVRVECNQALSGDPHIQVADGTPPTLGVLGVLNGVLGHAGLRTHYLAASFLSREKVERFVLIPVHDCLTSKPSDSETVLDVNT